MGGSLSRHIAGKVAGAAVVVAGLIVVIWYYRLAPQDRAAMWVSFRGGLIWVALVAALPWALFFIPPRVMRAESNLASALMLVGYLLADFGLALYLGGGMPASTWERAVLTLGLLCAAVYNFVVCESIALRADRGF